jgi:peptidoglycan/xylan/chitin deacetylase (PgdA/CDA1 family)
MGQTNAWDAALDERISLLSWAAARRLAEQGVDFGSHSATHPALPEIALESVRTEVLESREAIEKHLGVLPTALAYPYGKFNSSVRRLVQIAGYHIALSCLPTAANFESDTLALPRLEVHGSDTVNDFALKLW